MNEPAIKPTIPESYVEHRQTFVAPWVERWTQTNPFITILYSLLKPNGVELSDFSFNKDAANIGEVYLNVVLRNLNSAIRIGLNHITYMAANPDWGMAPKLVEVFDRVTAALTTFLEQPPISQDFTLTFHVTGGGVDLHQTTAQLVNRNALQKSEFYGISLHQTNGSIVIDKSLRYERAAFIRIQRTFPGAMSFAEIAPQIYEEEVKTLALIGIKGID